MSQSNDEADSTYVFRHKIKFTPTQKIVHASKARFKVVKAGRRYGKTRGIGVPFSIENAIEVPNEDHWYVAPTYRMASEIAWREFIEQLDPELIKKRNDRNLEIDLINGARIALKGSDNEDSLRGRRLGSLVLDEAAFQKPMVFDRILQPMLADLIAPALFISSPRRGWFTQLYEYAASKKDKAYAAWHFTIYDNPHISKEEIDRIKATTPDHVFKSEYLAEEIDQEGAVYLEWNPIKHISKQFTGYKSWPVVCGIDWGMDDPTAVIWIAITPEGYFYAFQEHIQNGWDPEKHAEVIKAKSFDLNIRKENFVLDTSAFRKDGAAPYSVADQFNNALGFYFQRSYKGGWEYGVNLVKQFLRGDGATPWLYIHPNCKELILAFSSWEYGQHESDSLAALRYGLTHAIVRKMTNLHEKIKALQPSHEFKETGLKDLLLLQKQKKDSWDWDNGIPLE